ncbi:hypothetical protein BFW91_01250 [Pseudomonas fluorescens]|mgnify:CR=1 FL=1|nr:MULTISPECIES: hypothetical protein [Pseudomonas fluorescens group]AZE95172.1 hypothetical protein C4J96_3057 [Pseudomonas orientalis]OPB16739.1 hypothetical protein BFW91_01250 [Pseudomonas fluorescens]
MISIHLGMFEQQQQHAKSISEQVAQHLAAGGRIEHLKSPPDNPKPPRRSEKIDPETVLKRKPKGLTAADRKALRLMANSL